MIGNIIILGIAASIIVYAKKVFWSDLASKPAYLWSSIGLCIFLLLSIVLPNLNLIKSPFTKQLSGCVIDSETGKPVANAIIITDYTQSHGYFPYHNKLISYYSDIVKSGVDGKFAIKSRFHNLSIILYPLYNRNYGGSSAVIMYDNYKITYLRQTSNYQNVELKKIYNVNDVDNDELNILITIKDSLYLYKGDALEYVTKFVNNRLSNYAKRGFVK